MRLLQFSVALALVACSPKKTKEQACEAGDPAVCDELASHYSLRATTLCLATDAGIPACAKYRPIPLDLPKSATSGDIQPVLSIVLAADATTQVDGKVVPSDDAVLDLAKSMHDRNLDVRAVIKADASVPHGRVIHVLDLLKQAGIAKIAFGVSPVSPP